MEQDSNMVTFDRRGFLRFYRAYHEAVKDNKEAFRFEKREYLVAYAKYLLEYLGNKFKTK